MSRITERSSVQPRGIASGLPGARPNDITAEVLPPPRDERVAVVRPATEAPPPAVAPPPDGALGPRVLLGSFLPAGLGTVIANIVLPRLAAQGQHQSGVLRVDGASYQLSGTPGQARVQVSGNGQNFSVALADDGRVSVGGATFPLNAWANEPSHVLSRFEVAPGRELYAAEGGTPLASFTADAGAASPVATAVRTSNPYPAARFDVRGDDVAKGGHRITNESSKGFPAFSIRGGVYVGVGAAQNYDHLTAARSDVAVLIDIDPQVSADHRGVLALVGQARDPAHFLSMLFGVPLSGAEQKLPPLEVLKLMGERQPDATYQAQTERDLATRLPAASMDDVRRIMSESRKVLLKPWLKLYGSGEQGQWLTDPERFRHLQTMQNEGRIIVRTADLSGEHGLASLGQALDEWNGAHSPPLPLNVVYLSNAEEWLHRDSTGQAYKKMIDNLNRLPLNPDGVMLRAGSYKSFNGVPYDGYYYQTMPMSQYGKPGDAVAVQAGIEASRRQAADAL